MLCMVVSIIALVRCCRHILGVPVLVSSSPGFASDILRSRIQVTSVTLPYYNTEVVPSQIG